MATLIVIEPRAPKEPSAPLRLQLDFAEGANSLELVLLAQNQTQAAAEQFRTALRLQGGIAGAPAHSRQAVEIDPNLAEGQSNQEGEPIRMV